MSEDVDKLRKEGAHKPEYLEGGGERVFLVINSKYCSSVHIIHIVMNDVGLIIVLKRFVSNTILWYAQVQ